MIFPRSLALEAGTSIETALKPVAKRVAASGDLRMERSTLERIEFIIECDDRDAVVEVMKAAGWRKLRTGRGPMVFARDGYPKATICVAVQGKNDLLGLSKPGNFEVLLFIRTGTTIFKQAIMAFIQKNGLVLKPASGLHQGESLLAWTEQDIFTSLGLEFIPPTERYAFDPGKVPVLTNF